MESLITASVSSMVLLLLTFLWLLVPQTCYIDFHIKATAHTILSAWCPLPMALHKAEFSFFMSLVSEPYLSMFIISFPRAVYHCTQFRPLLKTVLASIFVCCLHHLLPCPKFYQEKDSALSSHPVPITGLCAQYNSPPHPWGIRSNTPSGCQNPEEYWTLINFFNSGEMW